LIFQQAQTAVALLSEVPSSLRAQICEAFAKLPDMTVGFTRNELGLDRFSELSRFNAFHTRFDHKRKQVVLVPSSPGICFMIRRGLDNPPLSLADFDTPIKRNL
jgi:hypothetical protein